MLNWTDKVRVLKDVVAQAWSLMPAPALNPGEQWLPIFLAPEYFFSRSATAHLMDTQTSDHVYEKLPRLSSRYPQLVLMPGTIAFLKAVVTHAKNRSTKYAARLASVDKPADQLYIAHNTAYIFRNGGQIYKYRKQENVGEVSAHESLGGRVVYVGGTHAGTFQIDGLNFGIEVCGDHDASSLAGSGAIVDIHIVLSASVTIKPGKDAVREDGYLFHCDSTQPPAVYRKVHGVLTDVSGTAQVASQNPDLTQTRVRAAVLLREQQYEKVAEETLCRLPSHLRKQAVLQKFQRYQASRGGTLAIFNVEYTQVATRTQRAGGFSS
jgi:hypothetical protein